MDISNLIQNVGIVGTSLLCSFYFIKHMYDTNMKALADKDNLYTKLLQEEGERHQEEISSIKEVLNNNTVAFTKLSTLLENSEIIEKE